MRIVQIHNRDWGGGGSSKSAYLLHSALRGFGHDSKFVVGAKYTADPDVIPLSGFGFEGLWKRIYSKMEDVSGLQYFFQPSFSRLMKIDAVRKADVLHFHDTLGGYLNIGIIRQAAKEKPVVWSMRDMWAFTGHCVYAGGGRCEKWLSGCKKCPFLGEYPPILIDTASLLWKIKKNDAEACAGRVWCVSPSNWMCGLARKSLLSPLSHSVIPNCVDTRTFFPRKNRNSVRAGLGLPKNAFVLSFMAAHLSNEFKGLPFLVRALQIIKSEGLEPTVLLIGEGDFDFENAGITGEKTGFVSDENRIAELLSASDAFVAPSLVDNQPLAVLEALACGKPVIAFGAGGIPEIVRHKKTGFIAKTGNAESLAEGLAWVMGLDSDRRSKLCADSVLSAKLFSVEKNAAAYIKLYAQILKI